MIKEIKEHSRSHKDTEKRSLRTCESLIHMANANQTPPQRPPGLGRGESGTGGLGGAASGSRRQLRANLLYRNQLTFQYGATEGLNWEK